MRKFVAVISCGLGICTILVAVNCRRPEPTDVNVPTAEDDLAEEVAFLTDIKLENRRMDELRQQALERLKNDVVDPEPVLVFAKLLRPVGETKTLVALLVVDEDHDLLGIGFREIVQDEGGQNIGRLEEEYPTFAHVDWNASFQLMPIQFTVRLRDSHQHKDAQAWDDYVHRNIDKALSNWRYQKEVMPPVWVSVPEPNSVDVQVYLYDRAGHKSEPISLINGLG